jgi:hypothetical protein
MDFARAFGQQNATLREQLASMSPHLLEQAVAREIPTFREINRDPRWLAWLAERHEYSGFTRQQLLDEAVRTGNAHRVISFFRGFQQAIAAGRATTGPPAVGQRGPYGNRTYTRADIVNMSKLRMQGRINDADWMRWEEEMVAAGREGRIAGAQPVSKVRCFS